MITHHRMLGLISKSFKFFEPDMVSKLYEALVRPILEYSNPIWGPTFILDQRKNWNVQRRATRLVPSIRNSIYSERLAMLDLPSMNYGQKQWDLKLSTIILIQISLTWLHFRQQQLLGVIASNYLSNSQDYKYIQTFISTVIGTIFIPRCGKC